MRVLNWSWTESNNHCRGKWSKVAVWSTKRRKSGYFFSFVIFWTRFTVYIPSVVSWFDLKPICSSVSWFSYQGLIRFSMMFMMSLQTVDPMLKPRYLVWLLLEPLPFPSVISFEFSHAAGTSKLSYKLFVIRLSIMFALFLKFRVDVAIVLSIS